MVLESLLNQEKAVNMCIEGYRELLHNMNVASTDSSQWMSINNKSVETPIPEPSHNVVEVNKIEYIGNYLGEWIKPKTTH